MTMLVIILFNSVIMSTCHNPQAEDWKLLIHMKLKLNKSKNKPHCTCPLIVSMYTDLDIFIDRPPGCEVVVLKSLQQKCRVISARHSKGKFVSSVRLFHPVLRQHILAEPILCCWHVAVGQWVGNGGDWDRRHKWSCAARQPNMPEKINKCNFWRYLSLIINSDRKLSRT